jgi:hypothetical protein
MVQVAYSNSNCADLWEAFQKQIFKHSKLKLYLISDKEPDNFGFTDISLYNNNEPYYKVWVDALNKFNQEYFIYLQEDFFLYNDIDENKLNEYLNFLKTNPEYSFVRLFKCGNVNNNRVTNTLYEIESTNQDIFSMQTTIWRTSDYIKLMETVKDPKWLENDNYRFAAIKLNLKGVYHYDGEPKRGLSHFDSSIYPCVSTALNKGKWNLSEYPKELKPILNEYGIDAKKRGVI